LYGAAKRGYGLTIETACRLEGCRLLWGKLSQRGKRRYFQPTIDGYGARHIAANWRRFDLVRLFIQEFKWNINQENEYGHALLFEAVHNGYTSLTPIVTPDLEMARFLLENGANVDQGGKYGPFWFAVKQDNIEACHLLLAEYHANANLHRKPVNTEDGNLHQHGLRHTHLAIQNGNAEILRLLLEHGAFVGYRFVSNHAGTSLSVLLSSQDKNHETKFAISRILIKHAKEDCATAVLMQASIEFAITHGDNDDACHVLPEAGMDPGPSMFCAIRAQHVTLCDILLREYQVDPFLQEEEDDEHEDAASPYLAAARLSDTIIFKYFLGVWDERFASTGGRNADGDYPLHVVCCDPLILLQTVMVLVSRNS
jgi:hypothetical protein